MSAAETRVTDWFAFGSYGYSHYRIWQQFDGLRWFQRHEWKRAEGATELDAWMNGVTGWCSSDMTSVEAEAVLEKLA